MIDEKSAQVGAYFNSHSMKWDQIYSKEAGALSKSMNRWFRKGVYNRAIRVMEIIVKEQHQLNTVLDVGCGSGRLVLQMGDMGIKATGIDIAENMVSLAKTIARTHHAEDNCSFIQCDFMNVGFGERTFDVSIAMGVLDYVPEALKFLEMMKRCTGRMMLVTFPIKGTFRSHLRKVRLKLKKCPVYYYAEDDLEELFSSLKFSRFNIERVNNQYFVTAVI